MGIHGRSKDPRVQCPPGWPQGWSRILINPCRHSQSVFVTNARWNYILKEGEVAGSSPAGSIRRGRSSVVERVSRFINSCRHRLSRRMREELHHKPLVAGSIPASGHNTTGVAQWVEHRKMFLQILSSRFWPAVQSPPEFSARMPLELHPSRVRLPPAPPS
jgi:hypothetical protein